MAFVYLVDVKMITCGVAEDCQDPVLKRTSAGRSFTKLGSRFLFLLSLPQCLALLVKPPDSLLMVSFCIFFFLSILRCMII